MRVIDLTLPLYDGMEYYGTGNLPWEVAVKTVDTVPPFKGIRLGSITMYNEPGTRLLCVQGKSIGDIMKNELPKLVMQDTVLLECPKESKEHGNPITPEEIQAAIAKCKARPGDAILLHTGHSDNEKWKQLGRRWETWSPCLSNEAVPFVVNYLKEMNAALFGYDCANISMQGTGSFQIVKEWNALNPRPPSGLGPEAQAYTKKWLDYSGPIVDFGSTAALLNVADNLGCCVNLSAIKQERFKLIIAPLKIIDWGYMPATAYAIVDD